MRSALYAYVEDVQYGEGYGKPTDWYIDWIVTIYETGEPPQEWKMVKKIDEPAT
jgi:hypothetical protein